MESITENSFLHNTELESATKNELLQSSIDRSAIEKELFYSTNTEASTKSAIKSELLYGSFVDKMDYRGIHVDFYADNSFLQIIAEWNGQKMPLGYGNYDYKAEIRKVIDLQLDTIDTFSDIITGARLMFFDNFTNKDIKLVYNGRILKVYPVFDEKSLNIAEIKKDSIKCLKKVLKLEKFQSN